MYAYMHGSLYVETVVNHGMCVCLCIYIYIYIYVRAILDENKNEILRNPGQMAWRSQP